MEESDAVPVTPTQESDTVAPISVDDRVGSKELAYPLEQLRLPVKVERLEYADLAWDGNGHRGKVRIGVERKKLKDALSSLRTGRWAGHQLPGLIQHYDWVYLILEGVWREEPDTGILQEAVRGGWRDVLTGQSRHMAAELDGFLTTMESMCGIRVRISSSDMQTVYLIRRLYKWWQKPWDKHTSWKAIYTPPPPVVLTHDQSLVRRMANQLPGIGWERSAAVAQKFPTVLDMVAAEPCDWEKIPGIGKVTAERVVKLMREESYT